jgi:hypothetical protein
MFVPPIAAALLGVAGTAATAGLLAKKLSDDRTIQGKLQEAKKL